jgi:RNA polymerase sigma-70 factor (ECF subfamily)
MVDVTLEAPREAATVEAVYVEHGQRLFRSLLAYTGDVHLAEDAMAEAFAQALRRGDELREPQRWIWRASYRIAAGALKERSRGTILRVEEAYELPDTPGWLAEALAQLPERQRAVVVLHYYADLKVRDVGHALGMSTAAAKVALMRARRRLRTLLEATDG